MAKPRQIVMHCPCGNAKVLARGLMPLLPAADGKLDMEWLRTSIYLDVGLNLSYILCTATARPPRHLLAKLREGLLRSTNLSA